PADAGVREARRVGVFTGERHHRDTRRLRLYLQHPRRSGAQRLVSGVRRARPDVRPAHRGWDRRRAPHPGSLWTYGASLLSRASRSHVAVAGTMCGIVGIFAPHGTAPYSELWHDLVNHLHHRGPDEGAFWADGSFFLGARRLSVIDLVN